MAIPSVIIGAVAASTGKTNCLSLGKTNCLSLNNEYVFVKAEWNRIQRSPDFTLTSLVYLEV